jgi:hypothetical protein
LRKLLGIPLIKPPAQIKEDELARKVVIPDKVFTNKNKAQTFTAKQRFVDVPSQTYHLFSAFLCRPLL